MKNWYFHLISLETIRVGAFKQRDEDQNEENLTAITWFKLSVRSYGIHSLAFRLSKYTLPNYVTKYFFLSARPELKQIKLLQNPLHGEE
jgi:hypothetical protein